MRISDWSSDVCSSDLDLAVQPRQVRAGAGLVAGDDAVAAAVEARAQAERHVHVQRQAARDRVAVAGQHRRAQLFLAEAVRELRGSRVGGVARPRPVVARSEEHTSELQSLMRISYAVFCLKKNASIISSEDHTDEIQTIMRIKYDY